MRSDLENEVGVFQKSASASEKAGVMPEARTGCLH
jgi:hypothetical protein